MTDSWAVEVEFNDESKHVLAFGDDGYAAQSTYLAYADSRRFSRIELRKNGERVWDENNRSGENSCGIA